MKIIRHKKKSDSNQRRQRAESEERMSIAPTFTYRSRRSEESFNQGRKTEESKKINLALLKSRNSWIKRGVLALVLVLFVAIVFGTLGVSKSPTIIASGDNNKIISSVDKTKYQESAAAYLKSSFWNENKITLDDNSLSKYLLNKYPGLSSVTVSVPVLSSKISIYVTPSEPSLILVSANGAFVLDNTGRAIFKNNDPLAKTQTALPLLTDQSSSKIVLNQLALPANYVTFIQTIIGQLKAKNVIVSSMTLPPSIGELDVALVGKPYIAKFNLENNDARQQAGTFLATINQLQGQSITPSKYVDVRVAGRAYYQ